MGSERTRTIRSERGGSRDLSVGSVSGDYNSIIYKIGDLVEKKVCFHMVSFGTSDPRIRK